MFDWEKISRLVKAQRQIDALSNVESLRRSLELWWAVKYTRPFKDPLLKEYSLEELAYEFLTYFYLDPDNDPKKLEEKKKLEDEDMAWIMQQQEKILENRKKHIDAAAEAIKKNEVKPDTSPPPNDLPEISTSFET